GEENSAADSPNASLWTLLAVHRRQLGMIVLRGLSTAGDRAERQIRDQVSFVSKGIVAPSGPELARMSWLEFALNPFPDLFAAPPGGASAKVTRSIITTRLAAREV